MINEEMRARAQLRQDQYYKEVARFDAHGLEGLKAFLSLNAGGCVAMLGFMQALILKGAAFATFKPYGGLALCFFAAGVVFSALLPITRMLDSRNSIADLANRGAGHDWWTHATNALWVLAGVAFLAGLSAVGVGIARLEIEDPRNALHTPVVAAPSKAPLPSTTHTRPETAPQKLHSRPN